MEQTEEWTIQRGRYLALETLAPVCVFRENDPPDCFLILNTLIVSLLVAQRDRPPRPADEREARELHNQMGRIFASFRLSFQEVCWETLARVACNPSFARLGQAHLSDA